MTKEQYELMIQINNLVYETFTRLSKEVEDLTSAFDLTGDYKAELECKFSPNKNNRNVYVRHSIKEPEHISSYISTTIDF